MPNFDQTGPQGAGAMTGQGRGRCAGAEGGQGGRRQRRKRRFKAAPLRHLVGTGQNRAFVEQCIARLEKRILALQARVGDLKSRAGL